MLVTGAATLVGWYNDFQCDMMGSANAIIAGIRKAGQESNLSDASLTPTDGAPMWLMTLKSWSQQIKAAFECNNPESVMENASITEQYMSVTRQLNTLLARVVKVEPSIMVMSHVSITKQTLSEANKALTETLQRTTDELMKQTNRCTKLTAQVNKLITLVQLGASPASVKGTTAPLLDIAEASTSVD
jgi:hypothetical protein